VTDRSFRVADRVASGSNPVALEATYDGVKAGIRGHDIRIGFDVDPRSRCVRPELLRLVNRGTNTTADEQYALAA
jgi:hypothetical protein